MTTHQVNAEAHNGFRRMSGEDEMMFNNPSPFQADVSLLERVGCLWIIFQCSAVANLREFILDCGRYSSWRFLRRSGSSCDVARLLCLVAAAVLLVVLLLRVGLGSKILEPCFLFDLADILTSRNRSLQPLPRNPLLQHRLKKWQKKF
jgi:hypothetical protein